MSAAKRTTLWLSLLASALVVLMPAPASSHSVLPSKNRVELKTTSGPNRVELVAVSLETASRYYDGFGEVASGSPVAPNSAASRSLPVLDSTFTPNQATLNKVTAFDFYRSAGGMSADDALMHMRGIDFSKPVSVVEVPYGTTAQQLTYPGGMGNYFSTMGETATRLGIEQGQRVPILFQSMGPTKALRSTTSSFVWPSGPTPGAGGGIQFYIPNKGVFTPIAR